MAEDRKDAPPAGKGSRPYGAISNRDRKRQAPVIDATPVEVVEVTPTEPGSAADTPLPAEKDEAAVTETVAAGTANQDAVDVSASAESTAAADAPPAVAAEPKNEMLPAEDTAPSVASPGPAPAEPAPAETKSAKLEAAEPAPAASESAPPRRSGGLVAALLAGVAGAAIALGGGYALIGGKLNSASQVESLAAKAGADANAAIAAAEQRFKGEIDKQAAAVVSLGKQLAASEAQTKKLEGELAAVRELASKAPVPPVAPPVAPPAAPAVDLGPIEAGLGDLEKRIAGIEKSLSAPKTPVRASDPDVKPPAAAQAPATPAPAAAPIIPPALLAEVAGLTQRLKALESKPQTPPVDVAPLQQRLAELEKRLAPLAERIGPLEQKIAPLEEKLAPLAAAAAQNRDALGSQSKEIATNKARADAAALAVASRSLADAVVAGAPFAPLLKAAQTLGADAEAVKKLQPFADKGVPTAAALAALFEPLAAAMVEAENKPAANASFTDRLAASAGKLVRVRPADDTNEVTTAGLATRIGVALRAGRPADVMPLLDKLPPAAKETVLPWAALLSARVEADAAVRTILNGALARLAQP